MKHACAAFCIGVVVLSGRAHTDFGTEDDAIRAAQENIEPSYISEFMRFFYERLTIYAQTVVIETPAQRLAILNTVDVIIRLAHLDAFHAAQEAAAEANTEFAPPDVHDAAGRVAINAGLAEAHRTLRDAVREAWPPAVRPVTHVTPPERRERRRSRERADSARTTARDLAQRAALIAAERAAADGATIEEIARVTYRVAERVVFNHLAMELDWRLNATYRAEIMRVPETFGANHPLVDITVWPAFRVRAFEGRAPWAIPFIAPLANLLEDWMNVRGALQFQMAHHRPESLVSWFPRDIVRLILLMVAPQAYMRFPASTAK